MCLFVYFRNVFSIATTMKLVIENISMTTKTNRVVSIRITINRIQAEVKNRKKRKKLTANISGSVSQTNRVCRRRSIKVIRLQNHLHHHHEAKRKNRPKQNIGVQTMVSKSTIRWEPVLLMHSVIRNISVDFIYLILKEADLHNCLESSGVLWLKKPRPFE